MVKKVFVSGCFDLLHSGHIAFFQTAAKYGKLYVSIGSDKTIMELKHRAPVYNEDERLYILKELKSIEEAFIAKGSGKLDFLEEIKEINPDIFIVNPDGNIGVKRDLCESLDIEYKILQRIPRPGLPPRSSTKIMKNHSLKIKTRRGG